jgi:RNA 2',3'-cyclic 3'-phosphodiesterase
MRLFFSVPLPLAAREQLRAPIDAAQKAAQGSLSFGNVDQLHFTLAFLGEQPESIVAPACAAAEDALCDGFELRLAGAGAFPSLSRPRVAWLGLSQGEVQLATLAGRLREGLRLRGISFDDKPFRPHLTIARLRQRGRIPPDALAALERCAVSTRAEELVLVHSTLGRGAHHQALRSFRLRS